MPMIRRHVAGPNRDSHRLKRPPSQRHVVLTKVLVGQPNSLTAFRYGGCHVSVTLDESTSVKHSGLLACACPFSTKEETGTLHALAPTWL